VFIFGVINCSSDSLNRDSVVEGAEAGGRRAANLLAEGADGFDIGGAGSTDIGIDVEADTEWARIKPVLAEVAGLDRPVSIDTWKPAVARAALGVGASVLNASDGMSSKAMWEIAAEFDCQIVLPFLNGPTPLQVAHVVGDPLDVMEDYFDERIRYARTFGLADRLLLDPGTGFGPHGWDWSERYIYQKHVYSGLGRLRRWGLPLYIPLPWRETEQHFELLDLVLAQRPEFARAHYPATVREHERKLGTSEAR
jgi:dihydropteroate synthase